MDLMECQFSVFFVLMENDDIYAGLPRSGENIWKMKYFPGQRKVREFCGWPGKFRKDLECQGKVREFEKKIAMAGSLQKIYSVQEGKGCTFIGGYS